MCHVAQTKFPLDDHEVAHLLDRVVEKRPGNELNDSDSHRFGQIFPDLSYCRADDY